jgi:hypothetical protein
MQIKNYTHKNIPFEWWGGLTISLPDSFMPLKLTLNNNSPSWRLNRRTWLSVKQLKSIIHDIP